MPEPRVLVLHARGVLDVDSGEIMDFGYVRVEGNRITAVTTDESVARDADELIELPELTLVPGLMDMEVDLMLGGPGAGLMDPVRLDPIKMSLRAVANGMRTLRAGFTTVRNLGLFVKTGGYLLDVALAEAIDRQSPTFEKSANAKSFNKDADRWTDRLPGECVVVVCVVGVGRGVRAWGGARVWA